MEYLPFRVSTLRGDQKIDFNAYVKVNDKMVLYVRKGDSFEGTRLTRLKEKKLKKMFLKAEDEPTYLKYLERNIEMAYDKNSGKTIENRSEIIQGQQQSNAEEVFEDADNVEAYKSTRDAAEKFVNFLQSEDQAFASMMSISNVDSNIAHHGVTVSTLATMLAKQLNITDPKLTHMIALGSLLHDFDHFHNGLNISRPISSFTPEELVKYKNHPRAGAEAVKEKKHFDPTVIKIIMQHEEIIDGSGFPLGLREKDLEPAVILVGVCNALDRIITFEGTDKKAAHKKLMISKVGAYPLGYLKALGEVMAKLGN